MTEHPHASLYTIPLYAAPTPPSVPEGYSQGVEAVAKMLEKKAEDYGLQYGYDDMGGLSFGSGMNGEIKLDYYNSLCELAEEVRAMTTAPMPPSVPEDLINAIRENVRCFRHAEMGLVRYALPSPQCDDPAWQEAMIIPNISNATIDWVLAAAPKPEDSKA